MIFGAPKKSGKTTLAAIVVVTMVLLFGGRHAEAYVVANDLEQAQGRVFEMIRRIVEASPMLRPKARVTANRIAFAATDASITTLASGYASAAGGHPTICPALGRAPRGDSIAQRTWGYRYSRSRRISTTQLANAGPFLGRRFLPLGSPASAGLFSAS
jgi:hypothetical protein